MTRLTPADFERLDHYEIYNEEDLVQTAVVLDAIASRLALDDDFGAAASPGDSLDAILHVAGLRDLAASAFRLYQLSRLSNYDAPTDEDLEEAEELRAGLVAALHQLVSEDDRKP
ncbi:MAG: hypothetical protein JNL79_04125 [Myxococcales bacterium]|nr:hypothetical protein [Myxococcales bacterium]